VEPYIDALIREARHRQGEGPVLTAYFGGGTPTCLPALYLRRLLEEVLQVFALPVGAEVTVEANPGTLDSSKARILRQAGATRISLGVQSLDDQVLRLAGRIHTAQDALNCFQVLRNEGFDNISVDLMMGLPGQTLDSFKRTLERILILGVEHISVYPLKVEEGTPFHEDIDLGRLVLPGEDVEERMEWLLGRHLEDSGYHRYEISNYCVPGRACRHNMAYWLNRDYVGLGAGAHSHQGPRRWWNLALPASYVEGVRLGEWVAGEEVLSPRQQLGETVILALRTTRGLDLEAFRERHGVSLDQAYPGVTVDLVSQGLAEMTPGALRLTRRGFALANRVFMCFV
jgi:oxygen-independent coproporphyrinogen-3 oxidase